MGAGSLCPRPDTLLQNARPWVLDFLSPALSVFQPFPFITHSANVACTCSVSGLGSMSKVQS